MHRIDRSIIVPYSAAQMFALVADVDQYPHFLPWCGGASARLRNDGDIDATIEIQFKGVRSRFTTRNRHVAAKEIAMTLVEGPFRRLDGGWHFRALRADGCKVSLQLQYLFAAGLLGRAIAPVFEVIAGSMIEGFSRRAEELHGNRHGKR
jgi:ribosome-associated toxin RatA of RatAB toxin-antitoxin module